MSHTSYADVFKLNLDPQEADEILPGDRVRTGPNEFPHYEVVALHGDKAWVRDVQSGADHIVPRLRCRRAAPRG